MSGRTEVTLVIISEKEKKKKNSNCEDGTYLPSLWSRESLTSSWRTAWEREEWGFTPVLPVLRTELPYCTT